MAVASVRHVFWTVRSQHQCPWPQWIVNNCMCAPFSDEQLSVSQVENFAYSQPPSGLAHQSCHLVYRQASQLPAQRICYRLFFFLSLPFALPPVLVVVADAATACAASFSCCCCSACARLLRLGCLGTSSAILSISAVPAVDLQLDTSQQAAGKRAQALHW